MPNYYPVNLDLEGRKCLVAGAGIIAERKIRRLLECGARVLVISPEISSSLKALAQKRKIAFKKRGVRLADLKSAYLVISATGERKINAALSAYCRSKRILINVVDSQAECNFILPALFRRGALTIAVSTNGLSPALSTKIRRDLQQGFGKEYARFLRIIKKLRPEVLKKIKSPESRKSFWKKALAPDIIGLLRKNKVRLAEKRLRAILEHAKI